MHEGGVPDAWSCLDRVQDGQKWLDFDEITMDIKIDHESWSRWNASMNDQDMVECILIGSGINDDSVWVLFRGVHVDFTDDTHCIVCICGSVIDNNEGPNDDCFGYGNILTTFLLSKYDVWLHRRMNVASYQA